MVGDDGWPVIAACCKPFTGRTVDVGGLWTAAELAHFRAVHLDWSNGRSVCRWIGGSVGRLVGRSVGGLVHRWIGGSVGRWVGRSIDQSIGL